MSMDEVFKVSDGAVGNHEDYSDDKRDKDDIQDKRKDISNDDENILEKLWEKTRIGFMWTMRGK